jgi:MoaE-MoaD fusion protein
LTAPIHGKLTVVQIRVLFFGILKDLAGRSADELDIPEGSRVGDVIGRYENLIPNSRLSSVAISVNQEYSSPDTPLHAGDEIALLPPVSGGAGGNDSAVVKLVRERIAPQDIVPGMERPEDGAIVIFDGVIRDNSRGRRTLYLDYESYENMALQKLQELAADARQRFAVRNVAIVHRLGRIEIGESSVLIAVFSAHRAAAFDACRWVIDTLKKTVPIWKKEHFEDGAVWADGEPFPAEIVSIGTVTNPQTPASK